MGHDSRAECGSTRGPLRGELRPPPDKSITHRAALIGAMADGPTRVTGYLDRRTPSRTSAPTAASARSVARVSAESR